SNLQVLLLDGNPTNDAAKELAFAQLPSIPNIRDIIQYPAPVDLLRAIAKARSDSRQVRIGLKNTQSRDESAFAFCQILPRTHITMRGLDMDNNQINQVDGKNCRMKQQVPNYSHSNRYTFYN